MTENKPSYYSNIWFEEPEPENPFAAKASYCHGYNVTSDILPNASWVEYLFLLFQGEKPNISQTKLLEKIAIILANPGMRDLSIRAAMNAGVSGSTAAACLIAALGVGAGQYGGAREIYVLVEQWHGSGLDLEKWRDYLMAPNGSRTRESIWAEFEHPPGFDPNGDQCPTTVLEPLAYLSDIEENGPLAWLQQHRSTLEASVKAPLALTAVIAAGFYQLGFSAQQSEMLYLLLRLPGAAIHSLEQQQMGWRKFPFFGQNTHLTDDPGEKGLPDTGEFE